MKKSNQTGINLEEILQISKNKENQIKQPMEGQKIIVKGTDLFYKKLEVSSTQQIVSFECNLDIPSRKKS